MAVYGYFYKVSHLEFFCNGENYFWDHFVSVFIRLRNNHKVLYTNFYVVLHWQKAQEIGFYVHSYFSSLSLVDNWECKCKNWNQNKEFLLFCSFLAFLRSMLTLRYYLVNYKWPQLTHSLEFSCCHQMILVVSCYK